MTYFARKLRYGAHDGEVGAQFMALVEIAKKKGGRPVEFVLYQRIIQFYHPSENLTRMIRFKAETPEGAVAAEEAISRFWPWDEGTGKEFPGFESDRWERTTLWLYRVAVGGSYERYRPGEWIRIGTPAPWRNRHKKKPLHFGNLGHKLVILRSRLSSLEKERSDLESERSDLEEYDDNPFATTLVLEENKEEHEALSERISAVEETIAVTEAEIAAAIAEAQFKAYTLFPEPAGLTPRRVLRQQEEAKRRRPMW